jgi:nucleoside-diphosphate-sugar epimerase
MSDFPVEDWKPTHLLHAAYLTREISREISAERYIAAVNSIDDQALAIGKISSVGAMLFVSSGAATEADDSIDLYGRMKQMSEARFLALSVERSMPLITARIWSVSGTLCTKPTLFAFTDILTQCIERKSVDITTPGLVYRRYVDASQYMEICLRMMLSNRSACIESGGEFLEIGEIVLAAQEHLGRTIDLRRPEQTDKPQIYASKNCDTEVLAGELGIELLTTREQVAQFLLSR